MFYDNQPQAKGFTMIEVVVVLVIMGILAVVAVPRMGGLSESKADLVASTESLKSHLRWAQARAMGTPPDHRWRITFLDVERYQVEDEGDNWDPQLAPGEDEHEVKVEDGLTISTPGLNGNITFDKYGRPFDGDNILADMVTITLSNSSGQSRSINIHPESGLIE